ncbi:MAG: hypothetical protein J6R02_02165, partial [Alistipes sp.]|nr:hypothetical protein [Alistipes sp.]
MKNLFKNLMLVAVAAMAFTACTESNNEVNAVTKKVVLEFVADLADDDTRVAFGEKDGNKYPVVWEAYDDVIVKVGEKQARYTLTEEDVLESGKKAIIRPEFELLEDETLSGDIVATVNEYVSFDYHQGNKPTISLKAEAVYPATNLVFEHQYAYGKMELVGLPAEFNVTEVKLNLVGGDKELNHTINGNSVEDNIFWFTTEAMEAVKSFAVYASNGAVTYYREVTVEKNFAFEVGKVSAFRVKELVEKPADYKFEFASAQYIDGLLTLKGTDASDCLNIIVNPGLETLAAGNYVPNINYDYSTSYPYPPLWTSDDALEFDPYNSNYDLSILPDNHYFSSINLSVALEGDVYTIVVTGKVDVNGNTKTVEFTYNGPVSEPTVPSFKEAYVEKSGEYLSYGDCYIIFTDDVLGTLILNFYNIITYDWTIPVGTWTINNY